MTRLNILQEFSTLVSGPYSRFGMVPIYELRSIIAERYGPEAASPERLDQALRDLRREGQLRLIATGSGGGFTPEQLAGSIRGESEIYTHLEVGPSYQAPQAVSGPSPAPAPPPPPQPPAAPPAPPPPPSPPIGAATGLEAAEGEPIGIRVRMLVELTDASGNAIPGSDMIRDVTVNVNPNTSVADAIQAAIAYAEAGNLGRRSHETYPVRVLAAGVARVVEGGFDDPSLPGVV